MNKQIIEHLFEFWEQIGKHGGFLRNEDGFSATYPLNSSWPSKTFGLDPNNLNIHKLQDSIRTKAAPNSIAIYEDITIKNILESHQFISCSTIKAMALDTTGVFFDELDDTEFKIVNTK